MRVDLRPAGELCAWIERAAADLDAETPILPDWNDYVSDFRAGVPLLKSPAAAIDLEPMGRIVVSLAGSLASEPPAGRLAEEASALDADLRRDADAARRVVDWLLGDDFFAPASPGLLRYLGWTVMARYLLPVVEAFARWRDDEL